MMKSDAAVDLDRFEGNLAPRADAVWSVGIVRWLVMLARRKPLGFVGLMVLLIVGAAALLAPWIAPYPYQATNFADRLQAPSLHHLFGTDNLGRDLLSRTMYGARVSLGMSFASVVLAKSIATVIGVVSGYYGGTFDKLAQRVVDVWLAVPALVVLITLLGTIGASIGLIIVLVALINAPGSSRLIRSSVISVREEPYVEAARALGAGDARIMTFHVLPNVLHIVFFSATVTLGTAILLVASLGFLGYGVPPPQPDLGAMLSGSGLTYMRQNPWIAVWPGLAITLVVFSFNVLGDALRDVLDPRMRGT